MCRFFEDYKKNEHKEVKVDEFLGADLARKTISEAMVSSCPLHFKLVPSLVFSADDAWHWHCFSLDLSMLQGHAKLLLSNECCNCSACLAAPSAAVM